MFLFQKPESRQFSSFQRKNPLPNFSHKSVAACRFLNTINFGSLEKNQNVKTIFRVICFPRLSYFCRYTFGHEKVTVIPGKQAININKQR